MKIAANALCIDARRQPQGLDAQLSNEEVVARIRRGEVALFELLMRRHNQRLYRAARAILGNDDEAEDVMQDAYVRAYANFGQFAGRASFATWLTKICVHEALARVRRRGRFEPLDVEEAETMLPLQSPSNLEQQTANLELRAVLEAAVAGLRESYRTVFMLRDVEELSTAETAEILDIPEQTVKTRLHRARALLRRHIRARVGAATTSAFQFGFARCDRVVGAVLTRVAIEGFTYPEVPGTSRRR